MSITKEQLVRVARTPAGPELYISGVKVRSWFGTDHNDRADDLARMVEAAVLRDWIPK